jgi:hypothetical protein
LISPVRITGVKETLQLLDAVQPGSIKELRKDVRRIAEPAVTAIRSNLPVTAPLSGMSHYGRTRYAGATVRAELQLRDNKANNTSSLVRLSVDPPKDAAGLQIADMAGRKSQGGGVRLPYEAKGLSRSSGSGRQSPTRSRPVTRRGNSAQFSYRINGQGRAMIQNLGRTASRYVYPPLAISILSVRDQMVKTLDTYVGKINQKLKVM